MSHLSQLNLFTRDSHHLFPLLYFLNMSETITPRVTGSQFPEYITETITFVAKTVRVRLNLSLHSPASSLTIISSTASKRSKRYRGNIWRTANRSPTKSRSALDSNFQRDHGQSCGCDHCEGVGSA